jgi:hypothetical protein
MAASSNTPTELPIIDVSSSDLQAAKDILNAACTYGFVFIKGYESIIPESDINDMFSLVYGDVISLRSSLPDKFQSERFFKTPAELKEQVSINSNKSGKNKGWLSMHTETLDPAKQKVITTCFYHPYNTWYTRLVHAF